MPKSTVCRANTAFVRRLHQSAAAAFTNFSSHGNSNTYSYGYSPTHGNAKI
jgi:hypothetical protein